MKNIFKTKKLKFGAIALILVTFSSCQKYLDTDLPTNSVTLSTAFQTKGVIDQMMNQLYETFDANLVEYSVSVRLSESLSDNSANPTVSLPSQIDAINSLILPDNNVAFINWDNVYRIIYLTNVLLDGLPTTSTTVLTDALRKQYIAEAKAIRAYSYFNLVRAYGDVPLVLTSDPEASKLLARTPKAEVYTQIEKDLNEAAADLPATTGVLHRVTSKYTPQAMLADVYLTQGKWAQAETAATSIISSGLYSLAAITDAFYQGNAETIMSMGHTYAWTGDAYLKVANISWLLYPNGIPTWENSVCPNLSVSLMNSFEAGDLRKTNWTILSNAGNYPDPNQRYFQSKYKYNIVFGDPGILPGEEQDFKLYRLAEIYLIRAEARAQLGNVAGATTDLNLVRTRAGLANTTAATQAALVTAILQERRVELFMEKATRWFDLVRTNTANAVLSVIPAKAANWKPTMVLFPLTTAILSANPLLKQTPGY